MTRIILAVCSAFSLLLSSHAVASIENPLINPSFEAGIGSGWHVYSYVPSQPLAYGSPAEPTVGTPGGTFNMILPCAPVDGTNVCGMESPLAQSKNGGVYQTFSWQAGGGDLTVKVRSASDKAGGNGCYVRAGVAAGLTSNRSDVAQWAVAQYSNNWTTLTVPVPAGPTTHTVFIEAYQPASTAYKMSTLWDDVRWVPYLNIIDTPSKVGSDPARPDTTARIAWTTNMLSNSRVEYQSGTGPWQSVDDATLTTTHSVLITNLQPAATCVFRVKSTAEGCVDVVSPDYTFRTPIAFSDIAATTGDPDPFVTWKTDIAADSWVDYGLDTSYGQSIGIADLTTNHSVLLTGLQDGKTYHYRVRGSAPGCSWAYSDDRTLKTLVAPQCVLANLSFECLQGGVPSLYPWSLYKYSPTDQQIDGILGPFPVGGSESWFPEEVGLQAYDGSYFLGTGTRYTYKNGGVYQRIRLSSPQTCAFTARFATYQYGGGSRDTRVELGIDPTGGMDPNAASVRWWRGVSPSNDRQWYPAGVVADCPAGVATVFLGTRQLYGLDARAIGIDDVTFGQPEPMRIGDLRNRSRCPGAVLQDKIVTYVSPSLITYEDKTYRKIYVQEPNCPAGIGVLLGPIDSLDPPDLPVVSNKITVTGALMPMAKEHVLMGYKWTVDHATYALPKPLAVKQRDLGGSARNQVSLAGEGLCNLGVRMRIFGKVTFPYSGTHGEAYIDDGSQVPTSEIDPDTGEPVYGTIVSLRANGDEFYKGDYIVATGVLTMRNIGSAGWPEYRYVLATSELDSWSVVNRVPQE